MAGQTGPAWAGSVMVVEDDQSQRQTLAAILEGEGFQVVSCGTAAEAMDLLGRHPMDVAVVDLRLPDQSGLELLEELERRAPQVATVVYTAYGSYDTAKGAINRGAFAFVEKVRDPEELVRQVHRAARARMRLRAEQLEALVQRRTEELERINRELNRELQERQKAEAALRLRDRAINATTEGISITDPHQPDHPAIYVNRGFQRMTGYRAEEVIGRNLRFLQGPGTDRRTAERLGEAIREGKACCVELLNYRKDGKPFWNRIAVTPVRDEAGRVVHFIGVHTDVTERVESERFTRLLQFSVDHSADAAFWVGRNARFLYANQAACRMWGYTLMELMETPLWQMHESLQEAEWDRFLAALRRARSHACQGVFRSKAGETIPVDLSLNYIHFEDREYICGFARDVTERLRAEERLRQREAELAHLARVATLGEMAGGLAHELNQPMYAISNYAQGAAQRLRQGTGDRRRLLDAMENVQGEAHRASEIIARIRRLVHRCQPRRSTASINDVLRDILPLMEHEFRQGQVTVQLDLAEGLPLILMDVVQIQQVVLNLLRNAVEAMADVPAAERQLGIATRLAGREWIEVAVTDTGCGLAAGSAETIFDAFFTTKQEGLGMGLAISRTIIEAHGGRIGATPNETQGTVFRFTLPVIPQEGYDA